MDFSRSGRSSSQATQLSRRAQGTCRRAAGLSLVAVSLTLLLASGCGWSRPSMPSFFPTPKFSSKPESELPTPPPVTEEAKVASAGGSMSKFLPASATRMVGFVTGNQENVTEAQRLYRDGYDLFNQAKRSPKDQRTGMFADAAEVFADAAAVAPPALAQDSMFMQAEALLMSDQLTAARDVYETLQKDFPRNPYSDRAASRLFAIGKYWIDVDRAGGEPWYDVVNPFDAKVPWFDVTGQAIKVLDQIRFDDPTGKLADDATMAAAAEQIRQGDFLAADEFLTDLRETFTDSDHLFLAHLLGIRCKLEIYEGPEYSSISLEEAEKLIRQTRQRFPRESSEQQYAEMLARASAEVSFHQAAKLAHRANFAEKQGEYRSARIHYQRILRDHSSTPQAQVAEQRLEKIRDYPDKPSRPLAFMTKLFPDGRVTEPLETVETERQKAAEQNAQQGPPPSGPPPSGPPSNGEQPTGAPPTENGGSFFR